MKTSTDPIIVERKRERLHHLADATGRLAILAIDHRANLRTALSRAAGREVSADELTVFKRAVVQILSPESSAVLLDPEYGLTAIQKRANTCGLLLAYEKSGYDDTRPGRPPDLLPRQSVCRLEAAGAQAVKILLHYSCHEVASINEEKMAFVERVGAECQAYGLPFFLEIITYDPDGTSSAIELACRRPALIREAVAEFSKPYYGVDVLKLELPVATNLLHDSSGAIILSRAEAIGQIREALSPARQPVVFLSGGIGVADFIAGLELVAESGIPFHGTLCGRAVWNGGIEAYAKAGTLSEAQVRLEQWLAEEGRANLAVVRECLGRYASPLPVL